MVILNMQIYFVIGDVKDVKCRKLLRRNSIVQAIFNEVLSIRLSND